MEIVSDKKEAIKGYRECIKANPFSDLATRARKRLKIINF